MLSSFESWRLNSLLSFFLECSTNGKKITSNREQVSNLLDPLLFDDASIKATLRDRRSDYIYQSVHPADQQKYEEDGWELERLGKTSARMRRRKTGDRKLEDRVWVLLARMGYPVLGGDRFHIFYTRESGTQGKKQVDVFAKDDERGGSVCLNSS